MSGRSNAIIISTADAMVEHFLFRLVRRSAVRQTAQQDGPEITFGLCWQIRFAVVLIVVGIGSLRLPLYPNSKPARFDPKTFLPYPAGLDGLELLIESFLREIHRVGDSGHRFEADEVRGVGRVNHKRAPLWA